ncbi:MAG: hypothetical protein AAF478_14565 [Pseudomonadota bacterium]
MTKTSEFIDNAKNHLDQLGQELTDLEGKVTKAGKNADEWSANQVNKLKQDWLQAKTNMDELADRIQSESEASVAEAKDKAQRHWDALQAAVQTYRNHVEKPAAS